MREPDDRSQPPAPLPAPTAVTGVRPTTPTGRRSTWLIVLAVSGFAVLLAASLLAALYVRDRIVIPLSQGNRVGAALTERALKEYPGFAFVRLYAASRDGAAGEDDGVSDVFIVLADRVHEGFIYTAAYSAPLSVAGDPEAYENLDDFFRTPVSPRQPTDSFITMWMGTRPTDVCEYVTEIGESMDPTRTYEVDYSLPARAGVETKMKKAYYTYAPSDDAWADTAISQEAIPTPDDSVVDTAAAVAAALPAFEAVGVAQLPDGQWVAVLRHMRFPKLRVVTDPAYLTPDDPGDDTVVMFGEHADAMRARSFIRMWTAAHPRAIIDFIAFDPDSEGRDDIIDVLYADSVDDVGVYGKEKYTRLRYTKSHTWVPAK